ncbi:MAG: DNA/RNA non-specific endonuclease [Candidatus Hodarchaeales archaeon]|jgi:endonuclease G
MKSFKEYRELSKNLQNKTQARYIDRNNFRSDNIKEILTRKSPLEIDTGRAAERRAILNTYDSLGLERILVKNDFLNINYLDCGILASKSIGRIQVRDDAKRIVFHGTGFMVSPTLLLTCNHVLSSPDECTNSLVNFNYEDDIHFIPKPIASASFDPSQFFYTDIMLDFTLVAVQPNTHNGTPLTEYGFLKLIMDSGKALIGECVTIIQHPNGSTKQIALRENQVVDVFDNYIHYETDTAKGTSGAAVFNDQWEVVSLHHMSIMKKDKDGHILTNDGKEWTENMGEDKIGWEANEGIRISRILDHISRQDWNSDDKKYIDELFDNMIEIRPTILEPLEVAEFALDSYEELKGYDSKFLENEVKLPELSEDLQDDILMTIQNSNELKYTHFSIVMSKSRCLPFYSAVNIDGNKFVHITRDRDKWYYDPRVEQEFQYGPELYERNDLDRGHIVRRLDPIWGSETEAERAGEDTFHFTNCAPQHKCLNRTTWLDLERYILQNAINNNMKISVFTGPVFRADDRLYRGKYLIPADYWKIVVFEKPDGRISATGYLQTQKNLLDELEMEFAYGEYKTYQVPISTIVDLTKINFNYLRGVDPIDTIERAGTRIRHIRHMEDIQF